MPYHKLETVLLFGNVQVTTQAMGELLEKGVALSLFSRQGMYRGSLEPPRGKNIELRIAQFEWFRDHERALAAARAIVAAKIANGAAVLDVYRRHDDAGRGFRANEGAGWTIRGGLRDGGGYCGAGRGGGIGGAGVFRAGDAFQQVGDDVAGAGEASGDGSAERAAVADVYAADERGGGAAGGRGAGPVPGLPPSGGLRKAVAGAGSDRAVPASGGGPSGFEAGESEGAGGGGFLSRAAQGRAFFLRRNR